MRKLNVKKFLEKCLPKDIACELQLNTRTVQRILKTNREAGQKEWAPSKVDKKSRSTLGRLAQKWPPRRTEDVLADKCSPTCKDPGPLCFTSWLRVLRNFWSRPIYLFSILLTICGLRVIVPWWRRGTHNTTYLRSNPVRYSRAYDPVDLRMHYGHHRIHLLGKPQIKIIRNSFIDCKTSSLLVLLFSLPVFSNSPLWWKSTIGSWCWLDPMSHWTVDSSIALASSLSIG